MFKKGQISIETIMIYGAFILIASSAIGALFYYGVLDVGKLLPDTCRLNNELSCEGFVVDKNGVEIELINRLGKTATISAASVQSTDPGLTCTLTGAAVTIQKGAIGRVPMTTGCLDATTGMPAQVGEKMQFQLDVTYTLAGSTLPQKRSGEIKALVSN